MCANETDKNHASVIVNFHNQPVFIAGDIEHKAAAVNYASAAILAFYLCGGFPFSIARFSKPGF